MNKNGLTALFAETLVYSAASVVSRITPLIFLPLYTRVLTTSEFGILSAVFTINAIVGIVVGLQLESSVFRWYAEDAGNPQLQKSAVASSYWCQLSLGGIVALAVYLFRGSLGAYVDPTDPARAGSLIAMSVAIVFLATAENTLIALYRIQRRKFATLLVSGLGVLVNLTCTLYFVVYLQLGLFGVVCSLLVAAMIKTVICAGLLNSWISPRHFSAERLGGMLRYALPLMPAGLFLWIIALVDRLFLVRFSTLDDVGLYQVAANLSTGVAIIVTGFLQAWTPYAFSIKDEPGAKNVYAIVLESFVEVGCLLSVLSSFFAPQALMVLATAPYQMAYLNVGILSLAFVLQGVYQISGLGLALQRRTVPILYATGTAAVANIVLNFVLIPRYGRFGAAWATFISALIIPLMLFPIAQRAYFIPYRLMRCAIPIFGSLVLIETVNLVAPPASTPAFFVKVVLALALAAAMFLTHRNRSQKMGSGDTVFVVESS